MKPVWIVDDDQSIRWVLEKALAREAIPVRTFASAQAMQDELQHSVPEVLLTDIRMPGQDGLSLLQDIKQRYPELAVIIMTAFTDLDSTVKAFQHGAFDYLAKPFDINHAVALVQRAMPVRDDPSLDRNLSGPNDVAPDLAADGTNPIGRASTGAGAVMMQSSSPAMQNVFRAIGRLAVSPATVLVTGESGTGKELVARALHTHSPLSKGPFVALNAAAIPRDLLEAELFGHERGAFTGATALRRGRFEEADGGTLFLDEIGDMPLELQTRLLRVLAEGSFYRVGGTHAVSVRVRIVAATHQPLEQRVAQGTFREDLFHRLNVIRLRLPALRQRKEDIPALCNLFLHNSAVRLGVPMRRLTAGAMDALVAFDYPGNIRQLENFCHWLTVMSAGQVVDAKDLPPELAAAPTPVNADRRTWMQDLDQEVRQLLRNSEGSIMSSLLRDFERTLLTAALAHSRGRRAEAAQRLGIGRNTLTRKCQELGLDEEGGLD